MKLRFIIRDGKRILQTHPGKFGDWQDVPEQDAEDLESGEYRMGLRTVTFSRCIHNDPTCHCRES